MTETQKKTYKLSFIQDFGSIGFVAELEAESPDIAVEMVLENPEQYMPFDTLKTYQGAIDAGVPDDGLVFWENLTEEDEEDEN